MTKKPDESLAKNDKIQNVGGEELATHIMVGRTLIGIALCTGLLMTSVANREMAEGERVSIEDMVDNYQFKEFKFYKGDILGKKAELESYVEKMGIDKKPIKTAADMVKKLPQDKYSPVERDLLVKYMAAIAEIESNGKHSILGPRIPYKKSEHYNDRALGKYQIMPLNWMKWNQEIFDGKIMEPDPQAQEYITLVKFVQYYDKLKDKYPKESERDQRDYKKVFYSMASEWNGTGSDNVQVVSQDSLPMARSEEARQYCQMVLEKMGMPLTMAEIVEIEANVYGINVKNAEDIFTGIFK